ncbi:MAG: hypothetical protein COB35_05585 [Gammaproteobacteria bacterium]|nr:MAG: hypothetical protein COB35_05585 [Gammaproteobacteria bacterium]
MLAKYFDQIEAIGLDLFFAFIFIFIGLTVRDLMKTNNVPPIGQAVIYLVLLLGCVGFVVKIIIELYFESQGIG